MVTHLNYAIEEWERGGTYLPLLGALDDWKKIRAFVLSAPAPRKVSRVPYKCPVCDGSGQTIQQTIGAGTAAEYPGFLPCPACSGSGIVWNEPIAALPGGEK
jgi:hypothetical protein